MFLYPLLSCDISNVVVPSGYHSRHSAWYGPVVKVCDVTDGAGSLVSGYECAEASVGCTGVGGGGAWGASVPQNV